MFSIKLIPEFWFFLVFPVAVMVFPSNGCKKSEQNTHTPHYWVQKTEKQQEFTTKTDSFGWKIQRCKYYRKMQFVYFGLLQSTTEHTSTTDPIYTILYFLILMFITWKTYPNPFKSINFEQFLFLLFSFFFHLSNPCLNLCNFSFIHFSRKARRYLFQNVNKNFRKHTKEPTNPQK